MKRLLLFMVLACSVRGDDAAGDPRARALLESMRKAYSNLHAVHVVARKEDSVQGSGRAIDTDYEFSEKAGGKYFVETKQNDVASIVASNGEKTWKALPRAKQWSQIEAAGAAPTGSDSQEPMNGDLHSQTRNMFLSRYPLMAKIGQGAQFVKEENFKLGKEKILCGVLRFQFKEFTYELWIDERRGLVMQDIQSGNREINGNEVPVKITIKAKAWETDKDVDSQLFDFQPDPGWREVEMLVLPGETHLSLVGAKAADFRGKLAGGESFELNALRGRVVVVDFWATWCGPCMRELPSIVKLRQDFAGKAEFIGVNDEDPGTIKSFVRKHNYEMSVLMDESHAIHRQYGVNAIPTLLIIGRDGVIREQLIGGRTETDLRRMIAKVVDAPQ